MNQRGHYAKTQVLSIINDKSVDGSAVFQDLYKKLDLDTLFRGDHEVREKYMVDM